MIPDAHVIFGFKTQTTTAFLIFYPYQKSICDLFFPPLIMFQLLTILSNDKSPYRTNPLYLVLAGMRATCILIQCTSMKIGLLFYNPVCWVNT